MGDKYEKNIFYFCYILRKYTHKMKIGQNMHLSNFKTMNKNSIGTASSFNTKETQKYLTTV